MESDCYAFRLAGINDASVGLDEIEFLTVHLELGYAGAYFVTDGDIGVVGEVDVGVEVALLLVVEDDLLVGEREHNKQ